MGFSFNYAVLLTALVIDGSLRILAQDYYAPTGPKTAADGDSQWSFAPFLNKYYVIDLASRVNMTEFAIVDGYPPEAVAGGEHQYYNLTADGKQYVQNVYFPSGAAFNGAIPFVLGQEVTAPLGPNSSIKYKFSMTNATTVRIDLDKVFPDGHHAIILIFLVFKPDGSSFQDLVSISAPSVFGASATFNLAPTPKMSDARESKLKMTNVHESGKFSMLKATGLFVMI